MSGLEIPLGVITIVQFCREIISFTQSVIDGIKDAPKDFQLVQVEITCLLGTIEYVKSLSCMSLIQPSGVIELYGMMATQG